jgi:hypothetical protein
MQRMQVSRITAQAGNTLRSLNAREGVQLVSLSTGRRTQAGGSRRAAACVRIAARTQVVMREQYLRRSASHSGTEGHNRSCPCGAHLTRNTALVLLCTNFTLAVDLRNALVSHWSTECD